MQGTSTLGFPPAEDGVLQDAIKPTSSRRALVYQMYSGVVIAGRIRTSREEKRHGMGLKNENEVRHD